MIISALHEASIISLALDKGDREEVAKEKERDEACPTCATVGGYCGGSDHPSCGCFKGGCAVSANEYNMVIEAGRVKRCDI